MAAVDQYTASLLESGETIVNPSSMLREKMLQSLGLASLVCMALASSSEIPQAQSGTFLLQLAAKEDGAADPRGNQPVLLVGTVLFAVFFLSLKRNDLRGLWTPAWAPYTNDHDVDRDTWIEPGAKAKVIWALQLLLEVAGAGLIIVGAFKLKLSFPLPATAIGSALMICSLLLTILKLFSVITHYSIERAKHFEFGIHLTRDHKPEWQRPNKAIMLAWKSLWEMVTIIGGLCLVSGYSMPEGSSKSIVLLVGHTVFASCFFLGSLNIACVSGRLVGEDTYGSEIELSSDRLYETIMYQCKKAFQFQYDHNFKICGNAVYVPVSNALFWWGFIGLYFGSMLLAFGGASTGVTLGEVPQKAFALAWLIPFAHFCVLLPSSREPLGMPVPVLILFMGISTIVQLILPFAAVAIGGLLLGLSPSEIPVVPAACCVLLSVMFIAVTIFSPHRAGSSYMVAPGQSYRGHLQNFAIIGLLLCIMGYEL